MPIRRELGTRYHEHDFIEVRKHHPYDYKKEGILTKYLPEVITKANNETTRYVLTWVDASLVWLSEYIDYLKNFKNFRK